VLIFLFGLLFLSATQAADNLTIYLSHALLYKCNHGWASYDLLLRLSGLVAATSAVLTNDAICMFTVPVVMQIVHQKEIDAEPLLMCIVSSSH
jgi:Na+/H+ antiporter NhaD/arsenite permease-like protein